MGVLVVQGRQVHSREQVFVVVIASRSSKPIARRQPLGEGSAGNVVLVNWNGDVDIEVPRNEVAVPYRTQGGAVREVIIHAGILQDSGNAYQHVPQLTLQRIDAVDL